MKKVYISKSVEDTQNIAKELAKVAFTKKSAVVIGLQGELGGGKTTFLQGFAKGLGVKDKILSPTFVIFKKFDISRAYGCHKPGLCKQVFYHFDCYRVDDKEILKLGFKDIVSDPKNIVAIEWANNIKKIMPKKTIWIDFKFINDKTRKIVMW